MQRFTTSLLFVNRKLIGNTAVCAWTNCHRHLSYNDGKKPQINQDIPCATMRVVYTDPETTQRKWLILSKADALDMAKKFGMDLIPVNLEIDPPVCKIESYGHTVMEARKRDREKRVNIRAHTMKEVQITLGIEKHDFLTKMNKIKGFVTDGFPVKLSVLPRKKKRVKNMSKGEYLAKLKKERSGQGKEEPKTGFHDIDDTTILILTEMEKLPVSMQQKDSFREVVVDQSGNAIKKGSAAYPQKVKAKKAPVRRDDDDDDDDDGDDDEDDDDEEEDEEEEEEEEEEVVAPPARASKSSVVKIFSQREFIITPKKKVA